MTSPLPAGPRELARRLRKPAPPDASWLRENSIQCRSVTVSLSATSACCPSVSARPRRTRRHCRHDHFWHMVMSHTQPLQQGTDGERLVTQVIKDMVRFKSSPMAVAEIKLLTDVLNTYENTHQIKLWNGAYELIRDLSATEIVASAFTLGTSAEMEGSCCVRGATRSAFVGQAHHDAPTTTALGRGTSGLFGPRDYL
eukprot:GHVU01110364.1.p1 GENE.GHVU01110364.1~~GHVU01110364.1.p1  ORF type:complete len:198 (+),score=13.00 GHVU01110364.1:893-1486(+)